MKQAAIGISAHLGWAATATISIERGRVRVLRTDRIETAEAGDRDATEPFHVAGGFDGLDRVPPARNAAVVLQRGLDKQRRFTAKRLATLASTLAAQKYEYSVGAILVSRGRHAEDFAKQIGSHTQIHIEEGIAVRDSIARGLRAVGTKVVEIDTKSLMAIAAKELDAKADDLMAELAGLSPQKMGSWRIEVRRAALAAWVALARPEDATD